MAVKTKGGNILQFVDSETSKRVALVILPMYIPAQEISTRSIMGFGIKKKDLYHLFPLRK